MQIQNIPIQIGLVCTEYIPASIEWILVCIEYIPPSLNTALPTPALLHATKLFIVDHEFSALFFIVVCQCVSNL